MPTTPAGILSTPVDQLRTMLANVAAFQTWAGVASAADALLFVAPWYFDPSKDRCALVELGQSFTYTRERHTGTNQFSRTGTCDLYFRQQIVDISADPASGADLLYAYMNNIGNIINGLGDLDIGANPNYLRITGMDLAGWFRTTADEAESDGDYLECMFVISWFRSI